MLEVQVGPAAQSESRTALKIIRDEAAPVSVLVSFAAVRERPQRTGPGRNSRSQTGMICLERTPTDLESVLETAAVHYRHRRPHKRRACGPRGPTRRLCGQDGQPSEPRHESTVLTDLLTTTLDHHGHGRTEKPSEQGRRDCLDSRGRA